MKMGLKLIPRWRVAGGLDDDHPVRVYIEALERAHPDIEGGRPLQRHSAGSQEKGG